MKEDILAWMNRRYPDGFYCAAITDVSRLPLSALVGMDTPMLFHLPVSQLQELIRNLFEQGASPALTCCIPEQNVTGTLGDIALRARALDQPEIFLVISQ